MLPAIEIQKLGKKYELAEAPRYVALRDIISGSLRNLAGGNKKNREWIWALNDIDLVIQPGQRLGIIGRNGAGKSTLLKIISRITPPTTGKAIIRGRVGSLLEVGTGFHTELTGRENIFFNGSILGLKKAEIKRQLDAIIEFSGVEKFIDSPLKHFSSGMQLRLAFSVAAHLEPEILLVDEVLAVGDMEFQKKCIGKMEELSKSSGRTILFVSHDINAVSRLTDTCILLDKGQIIETGNTTSVINKYYQRKEQSKTDYFVPAETGKPQVTSISVLTSEPGKIQVHEKETRIRFTIRVPQKTSGLALSFQVMNIQLQPVLHFWVKSDAGHSFDEPGSYEIECILPKLKLYMGSYSINTYLGEDKGKEVFDFVQDASPFEVVMTGIDPGHSFGWQEGSSVYREVHDWKIQKMS